MKKNAPTATRQIAVVVLIVIDYLELIAIRPAEAVHRIAGGRGTWHLLPRSHGYTAVQFRLPADIPAPADYDRDGEADITVYRDGTWYIEQSSNGTISFQQFGLSTDKPVPGVE